MIVTLHLMSLPMGFLLSLACAAALSGVASHGRVDLELDNALFVVVHQDRFLMMGPLIGLCAAVIWLTGRRSVWFWLALGLVGLHLGSAGLLSVMFRPQMPADGPVEIFYVPTPAYSWISGVYLASAVLSVLAVAMALAVSIVAVVRKRTA